MWPDVIVLFEPHIDDQYLIEGCFHQNFEDGWQADIGAFGEFGDIDGYGASVRLAKRFYVGVA